MSAATVNKNLRVRVVIDYADSPGVLAPVRKCPGSP